MTIEKLTTNKEVSEKLKKLGVKQETVFYWRDTQGRGNDSLVSKDFAVDTDYYSHIPAYLISELKEPLKPYMKDIEISARDDIFNPDFWGNYLISRLTEKQNG